MELTSGEPVLQLGFRQIRSPRTVRAGHVTDRRIWKELSVSVQLEEDDHRLVRDSPAEQPSAERNVIRPDKRFETGHLPVEVSPHCHAL